MTFGVHRMLCISIYCHFILELEKKYDQNHCPTLKNKVNPKAKKVKLLSVLLSVTGLALTVN